MFFQVLSLTPRCPSNCCQRPALALTGDVRLLAAGPCPSSAVESTGAHRARPGPVRPGTARASLLRRYPQAFRPTCIKTSVIGENRRKLITKTVVIRYNNRRGYCSHVVYKNPSKTFLCLLPTQL